MEQRLIRQTDLATGEQVDYVAYVAPRPPKRQNGFVTGWMAMAQNAMELLAKSDLDGRDTKVFFILGARLDFENLLVVNQTELAREIGMQRQNFQRSVQRLKDMGVLLEGPRIGIHRSYRMNPNFGWKGSVTNHKKALAEQKGWRVIEGGAPTARDFDTKTSDMFEPVPA